MLKYLDIPPLWTLLSLLLIHQIHARIDLFDFGRFIGSFVPIALCIVAAIYFAMAVIAFRKHRTTINPHGKPSQLITDGIFKVSRNPIYTADALLILAYAIYKGELLGLVVLPIFVWVITVRFIRKEEAFLLANFPDASAWFERTKRW